MAIIKKQKVICLAGALIVLGGITGYSWSQRPQDVLPEIELPQSGSAEAVETFDIAPTVLSDLDENNEVENVFESVIPNEDALENEIANALDFLPSIASVDAQDQYEEINGYKLKQISNGSITVEPSTGCWQYDTDLDIDREVHIPDDDTLVQKAKEYIAEKNLYTGEIAHISVGTTTTGDATIGTERIIRKNVYCYPDIDNKCVYGLYRIMISFGDNGEIVGVNKQINDIAEVKQVSLKDSKQILGDIEAKAYSNDSSVALEEATIDECTLAYYADNQVHNGKIYIQPVYVLLGSGINPETGNKEDFSLIFDAVER